MKASLQRRLTLALIAAILATGLLASVASFVFGYGEAQEMQDGTLRQVASFSIASRAYRASRPPRDRPEDDAVSDPESRIAVYRLPDGSHPPWLPADLAFGFHTLAGAAGPMRVFVAAAISGERTAAVQATDLRDDIAMDSAMRTLIPIVVLVPILAWLTAAIVRGELAALRRLAGDLDRETGHRLKPLPDAEVPSEIASFVHAINRLLERVEALMQDQRRFVADAAHELRSPLTALSLQAQNVLAASSLAAMRERAASLKAGIDRMQRLVEQLLSLSRTQAAPVDRRDVDLPQLGRELIAGFLPRARERGVDLGLEAPVAASLRASPHSLALILGNALDNALRHSRAGGRVTLRIRFEPDAAILEVEDEGPGVAPEERERVFDAFYRGPGAVGEGSGLGLAIARDAAARMGATLTLHESKAGKGALLRYRQALAAPGGPGSRA